MYEELIGIVDVEPDNAWKQCWIEGCRVESTHRVAAVARRGPDYEWMHVWDLPREVRERINPTLPAAE